MIVFAANSKRPLQRPIYVVRLKGRTPASERSLDALHDDVERDRAQAGNHHQRFHRLHPSPSGLGSVARAYDDKEKQEAKHEFVEVLATMSMNAARRRMLDRTVGIDPLPTIRQGCRISPTALSPFPRSNPPRKRTTNSTLCPAATIEGR